ncbi:MAG: UbiX family flavin prenyltransferase [Anaerolineales bacterium]|nr:UbiX family flavin prenyltransferase [Anaerolineales bacterium]
MRIIIGVSGASGSLLAEALLQALQQFPQVESHLVVSPSALRTLALETGRTAADLSALAHTLHPIDDLAASIASGSFVTAGMVVIPCSMKTLAGIVHGYSDNLLLRAADVCLKERRKLVLVPRETPLSTLHLENLLKASQYGAIILPPMLAFYHQPQTVADLVQHLVARVLLQFGLQDDRFPVWDGG